MWECFPERLTVGIVDNDDTSVSRGLVRTINSMSAVEVSNMEESYVSAKNAMLRNEIYAFIVIPEGFAADANSGKQPEIALFSNDAYYVAGLFTYKALKTAAALANGAVIKKQLIARGMPESLIDARLQPVVLNSNPIGNPWLNYSIYLNNVLLPCMLQLLVLLMTVFAVGIEMKEGTSRRLLVMSNGSVTKLLFAKLLPQTILFTLMGWGLQIYLYAFLRFPLHCNLIIMFTAMFLMIVAAQALGIFLISILPVLRLGLSSAALFGVLGFSIVGFSLPVFSMYKPFQWIAELYPIRHYFMIYANSADRKSVV